MQETPWHVPHRIETERLELRRHRASDAEEMTRVITASKGYLSPWMPWARDEPISPEDRTEQVQCFMDDFDSGIEFTMGMFLLDDGALVGSGRLHTRLGPGILEIGYWLAGDRQRRGYATEAAIALTQVGLEFAAAERVELHHLPRNLNSRAVAERCGYSYDGRHTSIFEGVDDVDETDVWVATAESLTEGLLATTARPRVFDAQGTELDWPH